MNSSTAWRVASLVILVGASGCNEVPAPSPLEYVVAPEFTEIPGIERIREVPSRSIEVPLEPRAWDTSGTALETALADGDWHATVAFKAANSTRIAANTSGRAVRQAVTEETIEDGLRLLAASGVEVIRYNALIAGGHVVFPPGAASVLRDHSLIDYIEPQHVRYKAGGLPYPPPATLWGEDPQITPIGAELVRADLVWHAWTGAEVHVGIIDDGYDRDHADLYSISTSQCWDGDSNDCLSGWHGTFVAGVVAAQNNSHGVVGVAPGVLEDFWWCSGGSNTAVADCLDVLDGNVDIINMSFGSTAFSLDVSDAVDAAYGERGRLLVSIANNRDSATTSTPPSNMYPAEHADVIGVSGVMPDSSFATGPAGLCTYVPYDSIFAEWGNASNYGDYVELSAPFYTLSTAVTSMDQEYEYGAVCGTSFAAPHVVGVAALVWEKNSGWTNVQVREHLQSTARDLGAGGRDDYFGYGLVDACEALDLCQPPADTISVSIVGPSEIPPTGAEECAWSASVSNAAGSVTYQWKWNSQVVGTQDYYVPNGPSEGQHWLTVTVWDTIFSDSDGLVVDVDDSHSCF